MGFTTMTSREFNRDTSRAKRAAMSGPVMITDRGQARHVLLSVEAYQQLSGTQRSIVELLALDTTDDLDLTIPPRTDLPRAPNLS
ncbi:MAG: type II toxin-antitoxin system Phd/YefM family antitoxin [Gammaproteobacteria bacterium]|nr:type II toxin-antitoxin system Phd/YefM family antitoxin [Gammaproteobacteria bacterium]MCY4323049.1 type II toxin-antitoxin system Phd/YefM family antitoxin [Gammaproteobacteria bacterium]